MSYRTLQQELHIHNHAAAETLYKTRLQSESAITWNFPVGDHQLFMLITVDILDLTEQIYKLEMKIQRLWADLPRGATHQYLQELFIDEVVFNNAIEGVRSSRPDVLRALDNKSGKKEKFKELSVLYQFFAQDQASLPTTVEEIREIYDKIMDGELSPDEQLDGRLFRQGAVEIRDPRDAVVHRGFQPESKIIQGLETFLEMVHGQGKRFLAVGLLTHFVFETVHPFYDGNGRTGRYLLGLQLSELLSIPTALTLSRAVNTHQSDYYRAFKNVESPLNRGDGTPFVLQMLNIVFSAQEELLSDLTARTYLIQDLQKAIEELKKQKQWKENHLNLFYLLGQITLFGVENVLEAQTAAGYLKSTTTTATKYLRELESEGLVMETSARPLRYALTPKGKNLLGISEQA